MKRALLRLAAWLGSAAGAIVRRWRVWRILRAIRSGKLSTRVEVLPSGRAYRAEPSRPGTLRRLEPKVRGKADRKAAKRARAELRARLREPHP